MALNLGHPVAKFVVRKKASLREPTPEGFHAEFRACSRVGFVSLSLVKKKLSETRSAIDQRTEKKLEMLLLSVVMGQATILQIFIKFSTIMSLILCILDLSQIAFRWVLMTF